ncbi:MAG TPA: DNA translocase FtsK [Leptolyngbyaceae cyanobacterium]
MKEPTQLWQLFNPQNDREEWHRCGLQLVGVATCLGASLFFPISQIGWNGNNIAKIACFGTGSILGVSAICTSLSLWKKTPYRNANEKARATVYCNALGVVVTGQEIIDRQYYVPVVGETITQENIRELPSREEQESNQNNIAEAIISSLAEFDAPVSFVGEIVSPTFIRYKVKPQPKIKFNKIQDLAEDLKIAVELPDTPIIMSQSGHISIDVPRQDRQFVLFSQYKKADKSKLTIPVGVNLEGQLVEIDLQEPETCHGLVVGMTGSGKTEWFYSVIAFVICNYLPVQVKLALIDPKRSKFSKFEGIPWLLRPILKDKDETISFMQSLVDEMEKRYRQFEQVGVGNINQYLEAGYSIPIILVLFDEYADFVAESKSKKALEESIERLGQKAREAGIHLFLGTQHPLERVVSSIIKANLPVKIGLRVDSIVASLVALDPPPIAHLLLGKGDLICKTNKRERLQGLLVDDWNAVFKNVENVEHSKDSVVQVKSEHHTEHREHPEQLLKSSEHPQNKGGTSRTFQNVPNIQWAENILDQYEKGELPQNVPLFKGRKRAENMLLFRAMKRREWGKIKTIRVAWKLERGGGPQYKEAEATYDKMWAEAEMLDEREVFLQGLKYLKWQEKGKLPEVQCVYFVFDESYELYYVGCTTNLKLRFNSLKYPEHHRESQIEQLLVEGKLPGIGWEVCNEIERWEKEFIDRFKPLWNNSPVP